jgi:hypothetical protein
VVAYQKHNTITSIWKTTMCLQENMNLFYKHELDFDVARSINLESQKYLP